jgi:hypothetical protein
MIKIIFGLLTMLMASNAMAADVINAAFPYGMLALRGYAMEMSKDGTFKIYSEDKTFVEGVFSIEGPKITISDHGGVYACRGKRMNPGSYYWTVHDQGLYLMLIRDNCGARRTAFLEAPLKIRQTATTR